MFTELFEKERLLLLLEITGLASSSAGCSVVATPEKLQIEIRHAPTNSVYWFKFNARELLIAYCTIEGIDLGTDVTLSIPWNNCVIQDRGVGGIINGLSVTYTLSNTSVNLNKMCAGWIYDVLPTEFSDDDEVPSSATTEKFITRMFSEDFFDFELADPDTWPKSVWSSHCDIALLSIVLAGLQNVMQLLPEDAKTLLPTDYDGFFDEFYAILPGAITRITHRYPDKVEEAQDFLLKVLAYTSPERIEVSIHATGNAVTTRVASKKI
jgi:hypothetical protein